MTTCWVDGPDEVNRSFLANNKCAVPLMLQAASRSITDSKMDVGYKTLSILLTGAIHHLTFVRRQRRVIIRPIRKATVRRRQFFSKQTRLDTSHMQP